MDNFIEPYDYYGNCTDCEFRQECSKLWDGIIPYHTSYGECPEIFEININENE